MGGVIVCHDWYCIEENKNKSFYIFIYHTWFSLQTYSSTKLNDIAFEWIPPKRKNILKADDEEGDNLISMSPGFKEKENNNSWEFMFEQYKQCNHNTPENQQKQSRKEIKLIKVPVVSRTWYLIIHQNDCTVTKDISYNKYCITRIKLLNELTRIHLSKVSLS